VTRREVVLCDGCSARCDKDEQAIPEDWSRAVFEFQTSGGRRERCFDLCRMCTLKMLGTCAVGVPS
jgi:hypothetical protein